MELLLVYLGWLRVILHRRFIMEIKAILNEPYTNKQRTDFIVENNHKLGYEIQETEEALLAVYNEPLPPTKEELKKARQEAYKNEVDPITCHINRLKDEEQTPEVIAEIASLVEERKAKVEEIKQRYPYPAEESNNSDSVLSEATEPEEVI